ncbi:HupE/UreJ family protein [Novosphingobium sp. B1]|uniref:HupE/UreJ family protein n=1 Tax=Novosphingobium sp. B1 TaxID=1938756 RepID=UPI0009D8AFFA|nr:HupE/UreJ family protein [Novosphingobium sp. B1]SMC98546.1 HupE / UreJ protein [Novosphingobium sp. B1]
MISIPRQPIRQRVSSGSATIRALIAVLLTFCLVSAAQAHLTPNSEIRLDFAPGLVKADVVVPQAEFAYATGLATDNRAASLARAKARVLADMAVLSGDGRAWQINVDRIAFEKIAGPPDLHLELTLMPPPGASDRRLLWRWHVVTREAPSHFALLVVDGDLAGGVKGERELVGALTAERTELLVDRGHAGLIGLFANAFGLGAHHIAEGYDHLLFLLALLLPAPLLAAGQRWGRARPARDTFRALAWIVTAFTIGHSTTLILAAFFGVRLPAQPVEAGIAFSVLVSAIHAARPLFPGKEPLIAGLFGLVHGLAFATLVSNFGLGTGTRATAILGFNIGIEAVQLVVVVLALPVLLLLARHTWGARVRLCLAAMTGLAALVWLAERLGLS